MTRRVVLLVCGEPERGDDAAAFAAADRLEGGLEGGLGGASDGAASLERLEVRRCGGLDVDDLVGVEAGAACVVVDAVVGVPPGELVVRPLVSLVGAAGDAGSSAEPTPGSTVRPSVRPTPRSTHLLPIEDVLALAAIVRPGLPDGSFVGIGGVSFGLGEPLSPAVAAALPAFVRAIAAEAARLAATGGPGPS